MDQASPLRNRTFDAAATELIDALVGICTEFLFDVAEIAFPDSRIGSRFASNHCVSHC